MVDQANSNSPDSQEHTATQPADTGKAALINTVSEGDGTPGQNPDAPVGTHLGKMTLSMFAKGQYVRVRVGALHNSTELYEHAFESADEANAALLEAGILTQDQVPHPTELVGTGIELGDITAEQLEQAGLKRHLGSSL